MGKSPKPRKSKLKAEALTGKAASPSSSNDNSKPRISRKKSKEILNLVAKNKKKDLSDFFSEYDAIHGEDYKNMDKDDSKSIGCKSLTGWCFIDVEKFEKT